MRAMSLLVAVFAVSTQACAGIISQTSSGVPSSSPLPIHADARTLRLVPEQPNASRGTYLTLMSVSSFIACVPTMSTTRDGCVSQSQRSFEQNVKEPSKNKGPVILR